MVFLAVRRLINSPFGLSLRGIRENSVRMPAIGAPSRAHIRKIYTISAAIAGIAGAVLTQTTATVSLGVLDFQRSAEIVIILVLGGAGRLYGGLVGAIIFMVARDQFSGIAPQYWVLLDRRAARRGRHAAAERRARRSGQARRALAGRIVVSGAALSTRGLDKRFGSLVVASDINLTIPQGVRYALIGPNGAGKTTLINLITGMLRPDAGKILLGDADITAVKA